MMVFGILIQHGKSLYYNFAKIRQSHDKLIFRDMMNLMQDNRLRLARIFTVLYIMMRQTFQH